MSSRQRPHNEDISGGHSQPRREIIVIWFGESLIIISRDRRRIRVAGLSYWLLCSTITVILANHSRFARANSRIFHHSTCEAFSFPIKFHKLQSLQWSLFLHTQITLLQMISLAEVFVTWTTKYTCKWVGINYILLNIITWIWVLNYCLNILILIFFSIISITAIS